MKPLVLTMTSFGPYINETIDFTEVENKDIFLITGDTGSGKTTIFDAISVALFGETSGMERSATSLKSDFAGAIDLMRVTLVFLLKGKTYKVIRVPKQMRPKKRGEGMTEAKGEAELYEIIEDQQKLLAVEQDVTPKIRELIGLDAKQFRQIVMIPQGQFRKLLTENSDEREKILKHLFDVSIYQRFQQVLELKSATLRKKIDTIHHTMELEYTHIDALGDEELEALLFSQDKNREEILKMTEDVIQRTYIKINAYDEVLIKKKNALKIEEQALEKVKKDNQLFKEKALAETEKIQLESQKSNYQEKEKFIEIATKAMQLVPLENNFITWQQEEKKQLEKKEQLEKEGSVLEKTFSERQKEYAALTEEEEKSKIQHLQKEINYLQVLLPKATELKAAQKSYNIAQKALDMSSHQLKILQENIEKGTYQIQEYEEKKSEYQGHLRKNERIEYQGIQLSQQLNLCNKIIDGIKGYQKTLSLLDEKRATIKEYMEAYNKELISYDTIYNAWIRGQAVRIASELKEGDACPVCGNTHHIKLAKDNDYIPSQQELERKKKEVEILKDKLNQLENEKAQLKGNGNVQQQQIMNDCEHFIQWEHEDREMDNQTFKNTVSSSEQVSNKSKEIHLEILQWKKEKKQEQMDIQFIYKIMSLFNQKRQDIEHAIIDKRNQYRTINEHIKSFLSYEKTIATMKENYEKWQQEMEILQKRNEVNKEEYIRWEHTVKRLQEELPKNWKTEEAIKEAIKEKEECVENYFTKLSEAEQQLTQYKTQMANLKGTIEEVAKNIRQFQGHRIQSEETLQKALFEGGFTTIQEYHQYKVSHSIIDNEKEKVKAYYETVAINKSTLEKLESATKELAQKDETDYLKRIEEQKADIITITQEQATLDYKNKNNQKQVDVLKQLASEYEEHVNGFNVMDELSKVANGKKGHRITFERYILTAFLQDIIEAANIRLHKMSNGRYKLMRKTVISDKRKHAGLDLEVFDYYTGKERDVKTLSGGEGFKASLSLALGLGDVARSYAGGISIDTLFIDEGFGTLSTDALDSAINCLLDLNERGKLVGIISHVYELKERIDTKLVVEKSKAGSKAYFVK